MPFGFRLPELILIFVVALVIFGPKKLPEIGAAIGRSVTSFKKGIKEAAEDREAEETTALLEQRDLELKHLELEALERDIASKKATLNAYEATHVVEGSSESTDTKTQAN